MPVSAVDLFCGAGGLTCGLQQAGIRVLAGIDCDKDCCYAFEHNNQVRFIENLIQNVTCEQIAFLYPSNDIKVLVGCAPCQPFSSHSNKVKKVRVEKDDRWFLLNYFLKLIQEVHPDIVSMENVPLLSNQAIFKTFVSCLQNEDYRVNWRIVHCPDYDIPQNRKRLVLLASRYGDIELIPPTANKNLYKTVRDAIGSLKAIGAGESDASDPLHKSSRLTHLNLQRIRQSIPGGTWRDWDDDLIGECHKRESGKSYSSVYARMLWDKPAPTITTEFFNYGTGRFGHPEQDRALSLREGAILQTFPMDYVFCKGSEFSFKKIGKMIGNAVPVRLGEVIGISILRHLDKLEINYVR